jgi:nucleoside-diphosphate-sugar epimerase
VSLKKVLITGASGFIGHHCLEPLLARGYDVHAVSSRPRGEDLPGVRWLQADLLKPGAAAAIVGAVKPSHLLHLAWSVVPGKVISSRENFDWVRASMELVSAFAEQGGKRLAVSGTGYEYDCTRGRCSEYSTPTVPQTVYGSCKLALNLLVLAFCAQAGVSATWGRIFFLYGPREHPQRLAASVILSLLKGEPARCSHGRQVRDYMHVQDVADGLVALLDSGVTGSVNVSSGRETSVGEVAMTIGRLLGRPELIQLGAIPTRADDLALVVGDNTRLISEVGWKQSLELEAGLRQTIDWWRAQN